MNTQRRIALLALILAVAGALAWGWWPDALLVSVAKVARGPLEAVVEEDGKTRLRERYVVTPPVTGYMTRVTLHAGDPVKAGQALFALESLPPSALDARTRAEALAGVARADAALTAAEAQAAEAAANAQFAIREQARLRPLFDAGQVSKAQYDRAAAEADRAAAAVDSARAGVEVARYEKQAAATTLKFAAGQRRGGEHVTVTSPVTGVVLEVVHEDEGVVAGGQPVLSVGDPRSLELVTEVLSTDAVRIRPGMTVWVDRWGGEAPLEGRVRTVDAAGFTKISALGVEEQRVKVVSDVVTPPERWSALGDAYRVETRFVLWESADVLRVPNSSLFRDGAQWCVYAVRDGRLVRRSVTLGHRGLLHAEVLAGLAESDAVVTYPDDKLAEGRRVAAREVER